MLSISVIVPTHRRPDLLGRLLESIRGLDYPAEALEVIIVGQSGDPAARVVEHFQQIVPHRLVFEGLSGVWTLQAGAAFKRNAGLRLARGEIVALTDDDCVVEAGWLAKAAPYFDDPRVGGVEGATVIPRPARPTVTYLGSLRLSIPGGYQSCNVLYRRAILETCGGFDLTFTYYLEDTDLAYTVMEMGYTIPFAPDAVVYHPVETPRPFKIFTVVKSVELMPYLFEKHALFQSRLRTNFRPLNRSNYVYLLLYGFALAAVVLNAPTVLAALILAGTFVLIVHLAYAHRGVHVTPSELGQSALCFPIEPLARLYYWTRGLIRFRWWRRGGGR